MELASWCSLTWAGIPLIWTSMTSEGPQPRCYHQLGLLSMIKVSEVCHMQRPLMFAEAHASLEWHQG
jgi:hypothetical protein